MAWISPVKRHTLRHVSKDLQVGMAGALSTAAAELASQLLENMEISGGEGGIRTLEGLLTLTPLAGARLRPLGHLSGYQGPYAALRGARDDTRVGPLR